VERINGADGKVEIVWKTKDQSALHGKDYIGGEVRYFTVIIILIYICIILPYLCRDFQEIFKRAYKIYTLLIAFQPLQILKPNLTYF